MSGKRYLQIKNFHDSQMYKDRNPIWIKLHCAILDDYEFSAIDDQTKFHAVGLMLLASRLNNKFPDDERWLRRKINANSEINIEKLLEIGFLEVAKNATMVCKPKKIKGKSVKQPKKLCNTEQNRTEENRTEENRTQQNTTDETPEALAPGAENGVVVCVDFKTSKTGEESRKNSPNAAPPIKQTADVEINPEINAEISGQFGAEFSDETKPATGAETGAGNNSVADENRDSGSKSGSLFTLEDCLRYVRLCETRGDPIKNPQGLAQHLFKTGASDVFIRHALYPEQQAAAEREIYGEPIKFSDEPCSVCFGAKMADVDGKGFGKCAHCRDERGKPTGREPEES